MTQKRNRGLGWLLIITLLVCGALVGIGGLIMAIAAIGLLFACGVMGAKDAARDAGEMSEKSARRLKNGLCGAILACKELRKGVKTLGGQVHDSGGNIPSDLCKGFRDMRDALRRK